MKKKNKELQSLRASHNYGWRGNLKSEIAEPVPSARDCFVRLRRTRNDALQQGFTLIEVLLAVTLSVIVLSSSYGIFSMGIQIWKRTQTSALAERKALLALEKMAHDVQRTIKIKKTKDEFAKKRFEFGGNREGFTLPAIVTFSSKSGELVTQYGRMGYYWDAHARRLCRTSESATDFYLSKEPACNAVAEPVTKIQFRFWLYGEIAESYSWYDSWNSSDGLPQAIQITMEIESKLPDGKSTQKRQYRRTFLIPVGGKP